MMASRGPLYIGVDAGTSACKAILVDEGLDVSASAWRTYPTRRLPDGSVTQEAEAWLAAVADVLRECVAAAQSRAVAAISVTAPAHNVVLVGPDGEALAPVVLWSDTRCTQVARELAASVGETLFKRTFAQLGPTWSLPQLVWLRREHPELWPRLRSVLPAKDFIRWRMTGEALTDPSDAAGTAMYDQTRLAWLPEATELAGLATDLLPTIRPAASLGGGLTQEWARMIGLPAGTPVTVGATDTAAELLSLGATEPGSSLVKIASTGTVVAVSQHPRPDPRVMTYPHVLTDRWYTVSATNTAATAYGWLRGALFGAERTDLATLYKTMDDVASQVGPGAGGILFLPFLDGERGPLWDPDLRAAFLGLSSWHSRPHLCRAVLEGVALSLRSCRDLLNELGLPTNRPRLAGGGMASAVWRELLVGVLGEEGILQEPQGPALGAAMLAMMATGVTTPRHNPAVRQTAVRCPPTWPARYDRLYELYRQACEAISSLSHDLADVGRVPESASIVGTL